MKAIFKIFLFTLGYSSSVGRLVLSIYPMGKTIICKESDDLNLTCRVSYLEKPDKNYNLSWNLPIKINDDSSRVTIFKGQNELTVTVHKLLEADTGQYICEVNEEGIARRQTISVIVKTAKEKCLKPFFGCGNGLCIPWHYVCDGFKDCRDGNDESFKHCGADACHGKFLCDGRCIPKKLCCDARFDTNCSVSYLMPCCHRLMHIVEMESSESPVQYKYHNIGFYNSTVYTMISCAVAFIFMAGIMLIAVCRMRMRHAALFFQSSRPNQFHRSWYHTATGVDRRDTNLNPLSSGEDAVISFQDDTHQLGHSDTLDPLENFVLLTYDANVGFQVAEYGPKPPPYTESNVGIPPPPYTSMIDITSEAVDSETRLDEPERMPVDDTES